MAISAQTVVPVLVDPSRGVVVIESRDTIDYLKEQYGGRTPPPE
jgi:glutathione S-transferase